MTASTTTFREQAHDLDAVLEGLGPDLGPRALVTGAGGFLGRHLVEALVRLGCEVRALDVTPAFIERTGIETVIADVRDEAAVAAACAGVDVVFHTAARIVLHGIGPKAVRDEVWSINEGGTRTLLAAARAAGVGRFVFTSTHNVVLDGPCHELDETAPYATHFVDVYTPSKIAAERALWAFHRKTGFPVISLNPSLILGPGDDRVSSTGDVKLFLERKLPSIPWGGLSYVDVRDLAPVFVRAATQGEVGIRYPLGAVNCTVAHFLQDLERLSGVKGPRLRLPKRLELLGARVMERAMRAMGKAPDLDYASAQMSQRFWYIDSSRARAELGFSPRPTDETLRDTIAALRGAGG